MASLYSKDISLPGVSALRVKKTDSTGSYSYVCDGTTPGSPVLSDGHTIFTAGLSSTVAGVTSFRHEDALGSLRFLTNSSQSVTGSRLFEALGAPVGLTGRTVPFGWVGGADCQTEADTGLVLMGHRYYDSRLGRFISQDPAGDGDNWYAYVGNDPINGLDPSGLKLSKTDQWWYMSSDHNYDGGSYNWDDQNNLHYNDTDGTHVTLSQGVDLPGGGASGGGLFEGVGGAFGVGFSAVGSDLSMGLWNGGAARNDPSFKTSQVLGDVGIAAAAMVIPGGGEAKGADELEELTQLWHEADRGSSEANLLYHYGVHKGDVNAKNILEYARKAAGHLPQAKSGAAKHAVEGATQGVMRYRKAGRYMDLAPDGKIISFGR